MRIGLIFDLNIDKNNLIMGLKQSVLRLFVANDMGDDIPTARYVASDMPIPLRGEMISLDDTVNDISDIQMYM